MDSHVDRAFEDFRNRGTAEDRTALLEACRPRAVGLCLRILRNREDAEDAAQHVLLEVARHASEMTNAACFRSWLFNVCRARSLDVRRRRARRECHEARAATGESSNGNGSHPPDDDARRILFAALAELPEADRALVLGHYFEKKPLRELAEERGCSKVAVWKRIERIRASLLRKLARTGWIIFLPTWKLMLQGEPRPRSEATLPGSSSRRVRTVGSSAPSSRAVLWLAGAAAGLLVFTLGMTAGVTVNRPRRPEAGVAVSRKAFDALKPAAAPSAPPPAPAPEEAPPAAVAGKEAPREDLKELIRRLFRQIQFQRNTGHAISPELSMELAPLMDITRQAHRHPSKNPERYARFVSLLYEVAAEECGVEFSTAVHGRIEAQEKSLSSALSRVPDNPAPVRLLAAVEADLAFAREVSEVLPKDQAGRMMASDIDRILKRGKRKSMPEASLLQEIAGDWAKAIRNEAGAMPLVKEAAARLSTALARITQEFQDRVGDSYDEDDYSKNMLDRIAVRPYDPVRRMEYQVESLKAQIDALDFVRNAIDPSKAGLLTDSEPWNYAVSRKGTLIELRGE